jgi:hypothetical protein
MILRAILAGLLFTGASPAAEAVSDSTRTIGIEVLDDKLVLVQVTVNGTGPHLFLLDTGGASTVVSDTLARELGLTPAGSHRIDTMSGSRTVARARVEELRLGPETFTGVDVLWMDLTNVRAGDARIQGVIGQNLLRTRSFLLDYESRRLTFDRATPHPNPLPASGARESESPRPRRGRGQGEGAAARDGQRLPLEWSDGRPMIHVVGHHTGRGGAGRTSAALRFVIDSGGTHVILFDQSSPAQPLLNALRRGAATTMTMTSHAGSRPVMTATVDRLELAEGTAWHDLVAALVPVDPAQGRIEDGLLPASLFRSIYFDNRAGEVMLRARR